MAAVPVPASSNDKPAGGVAAYMRVSGDIQKQQGTIENQRTAINRYFAIDGVQVYGWYEDEAVSGYYIPFEHRPDGKRLLADVQAGRVSLLVVTKLDRLGRNAFEILRAVRQIEAAGARLVSLKENVDTSTSAGRFFLTVLAGVAELERDSILERAEAGTARRLGNTETSYMGGSPLYGYRVEGRRKDARLVIDDTLDEASGYSEADVVRLCWHLLVEDDWTTIRIASRLSELGIPTRNGGKWIPDTVRGMLTDMAYAGSRTYRREDGTTYTLSIPAILTPEQIEQARAVLASHRITARTRQAGPDPYLLRGLLRCNECGQLYTTARGGTNAGTQKPDRVERRRYYVCSTRQFAAHPGRKTHPERFTHDCIGKCVDALTIELDIWAQIARWIEHPGEALDELAAQRAERNKEADSLRAEAEDVQADRDALQAERNKVVTLYRTGIMTEADVTYQLADLSDKDATLRERADALAAKLRETSDEGEGLDRARALLQRLHARVDSEPLTLSLQREVISDLVKEVKVKTLPAGTSTRGRKKYRARTEVTFTFRKPAPTSVAAHAVCVDTGDESSSS